MKRIILVVLFIFAAPLLQAADIRNGRPESVDMSSERLDRIKPFMQEYIDEGKLVGIQTLVARRGRIVHFETVGDLDKNTGAPLEDDSLFRIYSMSKPVVTLAAMMLHEEGKFNLDEPIAKYMPAFKDVKVLVDGEEVEADHAPTIRELMSHTAGLTYGIFSNTDVDKMYREKVSMFQQGRPTNLEEFVDTLGPIPLLYQPGSRWVYSVSVDVLGRLIEVVSGMPLDQYLDENLFSPLGMDDTFFEVPADKVDRFGTNHSLNRQGELIVTDKPEDSAYTKEVTFFSGGGGLVSTTMDYLKFCQMMLNGGELNGVRIVSPKTIEVMTINHLPDGVLSGFGERPGVAGTVGFGLGFGVATEQPKTSLGSKGEYTWGGAAGTIFWIDPEEELTAILMVQMMRNPYPLRTQFRNLVYQAITE